MVIIQIFNSEYVSYLRPFKYLSEANVDIKSFECFSKNNIIMHHQPVWMYLPLFFIILNQVFLDTQCASVTGIQSIHALELFTVAFCNLLTSWEIKPKMRRKGRRVRVEVKSWRWKTRKTALRRKDGCWRCCNNFFLNITMSIYIWWRK